MPQRRRFDVVMAWAIDRLGRSLIDLLGTIQTLETCGVDLYLDQQSIDTTTPAGRLMFQITGAFAEFERGMIRQRINAGLKKVAAGQRLGRPRIDPALEKRIQGQLRERDSPSDPPISTLSFRSPRALPGLALAFAKRNPRARKRVTRRTFRGLLGPALALQ
jgi:Resolvase, N terminal domain